MFKEKGTNSYVVLTVTPKFEYRHIYDRSLL
jgi:hypothetical protein